MDQVKHPCGHLVAYQSTAIGHALERLLTIGPEILCPCCGAWDPDIFDCELVSIESWDAPAEPLETPTPMPKAKTREPSKRLFPR
jgi:hypothetical protein